MVAAARCFTRGPELPPDTGSTRGDLRELVDGLIAMLTTTPLGRVLPILVAARTRVAELDRAYAEIVAEKRARSAIVVRRAIERGDLRADVDLELVDRLLREPDLLPLPHHQRRRSTRRSPASRRRRHPSGLRQPSAAVHDSRR